MTDDNQEIIDRIEKAKANKDKLPHVRLKTPMTFKDFEKEWQASGLEPSWITAACAWDEASNARDAEIEQLREEVSDAKNIIHDIRMKCVNSENIIDVIAYIYEVATRIGITKPA